MSSEGQVLLLAIVVCVAIVIILIVQRRKERRAAEERQRRIRHFEQMPTPIARRPQPKAAPAAASSAPAPAPVSSTTDDNGIVPVALVHAVIANSHQQPAVEHVSAEACAAAYVAPTASPAADLGAACGTE